MKALALMALLLPTGGPHIAGNPAPAPYTEKSILIVPIDEEGKQWSVRPIKVPSVSNALPCVCFGRPNDRQVSCFYMVGNEAIVVPVTLEGENV